MAQLSRKILLRPLFFLAMLISATAGVAAQRVLLISIDGFRPDFYLDDHFEAPTLRKLLQRGIVSSGVDPIFPSLTYPVHATLVTGVESAIHGVLSNQIFDPRRGPQNEWYWDSSRLKVPPIWDLLKKRGRSVAIIRWPASLGAKVDWLWPEVFHSPGFDFSRDWDLIEENTDKEFFKEIVALTGITALTSLKQLDELSAAAAAHVQAEHRPDLMLVHLVNIDLMEHLTGKDSPQSRKALLETDALIGKIVASVDLTETVVILLGDHGFRDYRKTIQVNTLFGEKNWFTVKDGKISAWEVLASAEGGQAAVYLRDPAQGPEVLRLLDTKANGLYRIIPKDELDKWNAYPDALCALESAEGYAFGGELAGPLVVDTKGIRGAHGWSPMIADMRAGLIAFGKGILPGRKIGIVRSVDVAPTVAALLGFSIPGAEGTVFQLQGN